MKFFALVLLLSPTVFAFVLGPNWSRNAVSSSKVLFQATTDSCDVAIFGAGFGGLYTALTISREARLKGKKLDIALIEPSESFVFLPLLYDLTVGTATEAEVCPSYRELLLGTGVRQIKASLDSIDINNSQQCAQLKPASPQSPSELNFRGAVISVGASPESILARVPGASEYAQPFYTEADAKSTRRLLARLEQQADNPRIAVVGGGFGGVELAASVKRKLPSASVTLLSRGPPMAGTRAEALIDKALRKMGVNVVQCTVDAIEPVEEEGNNNNALVQRVRIKTTKWNSNEEETTTFEEPWDSVMWTAGSSPAFPVSEGLNCLRKSESGRLAIDSSLRCFVCEEVQVKGESEGESRTLQSVKFDRPNIWALGDCAEIVSVTNEPAVPKTAQAAMQQADVVAFNLLAQLEAGTQTAQSKKFQYQDLGSMLTLGGPNAAMMAPKEGAFAPLFGPMFDTVGGALDLADKLLESTVGKSPVLEKLGLSPETLGLSLGSYGIGADSSAAPGTLAGTLTGAARRAVYAVRMPTNRQRAIAATSAAISTAAALAKEAAARTQD